MPGYKQCEFGNMDALKAMINENTAGIILEPIQGEGGCRAASDEYLTESVSYTHLDVYKRQAR